MLVTLMVLLWMNNSGIELPCDGIQQIVTETIKEHGLPPLQGKEHKYYLRKPFAKTSRVNYDGSYAEEGIMNN